MPFLLVTMPRRTGDLAYDPKRIGSYRPKIDPHHLRRLWLEKQRQRVPMTKILAEALDEYFDSRQA